ncbi:MAG: helicase-related protein [Pusillimonas sp.]
MTTTHFFNNTDGQSLFAKLKSIAQNMANFDNFLAVTGYFRSSGYFKLREELKDVKKIQILAGINVDNIFKKHNKAMLMLESPEEARKIYSQDFIDDVREARYSKDVEDGILQLFQDLKDGKVEIRVHSSKNLHAKFYLCLPENHNESSDGWVIMGSSNLSDSGLGTTQTPRYELNVAMKDYDDVKYCKDEFDKLWGESVAITTADINSDIVKTHLGVKPTPYELYIKVLIDTFGDQIEDNFTIDTPKGVRDLKYQKDAVIQGYQMLLAHNGFFLADVVGLGKTIVATMIAKRFIESNGHDTRILVVHPPALKHNWEETFKLFEIHKKANFVPNGSLSKVLEGKERYGEPEDYDLIIVDEAHRFRTGTTMGYDELQRICKSERHNTALVKGPKKIMLLSATPLNNRPEDLKNLILLFQDAARCTVEGVSNLDVFFAPFIGRYKNAMSRRNNTVDINEIDKIYGDIRNNLLDKITVRRTRHNIVGDESYRKDLTKQKIIFPNILPPCDFTYQMDTELCNLFYNTLLLLTDTPTHEMPNDKGLYYARYRAIEHLKEEYRSKYKGAEQVAKNLANIYRVHMVKRLESSFYAFYRSLETLRTITEDMIKMFADGRIIIATELNVKEYIRKAGDKDFDLILDEFISKASRPGFTADEFVFAPEDFDEHLLPALESDLKKITQLKAKWQEIEKKGIDPKLDLFVEKMQTEFFNRKQNPTGKLVVFSESVDTVNYLTKALQERLNRTDVLSVSSKNRKALETDIRECFDANYEKASDEYNIIITSDVLSEGINLHRSNVIVNYDTPWNATRLMQRIGRVNRIGSVAKEIYNYMFYPSNEGDKQIQLYNNALIKLQGFHSALGEDAKIFSKEEMLREFKYFNPDVTDKVDKQLQLMREVRELYHNDRELYKKIKSLPLKCRVGRHENELGKGKENTTIAFIQSPRKTEYFLFDENKLNQIDFLDAVDILRAGKEEKAADMNPALDLHYKHVNAALDSFQTALIAQLDENSLTQKIKTNDRAVATAQKFLRLFKEVATDNDVKLQCDELNDYVTDGKFQQLNKSLKKLASDCKNDKTAMKANEFEYEKVIGELYKKYHADREKQNAISDEDALVIVSETFVK